MPDTARHHRDLAWGDRRPTPTPTPIPGSGVRHDGLRQLAILAGCLAVDTLLRRLLGPSFSTAVTNGHGLLDFEGALGVGWESPIHSFATRHRHLLSAATTIRTWGYLPIITAALVGTWFGRRQSFYLIRNAVIVSGGLGLILFVLTPTLSPNLLTTSDHGETSALEESLVAFPNPQLVVAIVGCMALASCCSREWLQNLFAIPVVIVALADVASGEGYVLGGVAGLALATASLVAVRSRSWPRAPDLRPSLA